MNRYTRVGIITAITVGMLVALHFLVFAPLARSYSKVDEELKKNKDEWNRISLGLGVPPDKKGALIAQKRKANAQNLASLNQVYGRYKLADPPSVSSATSFLDMIHVYQDLELSEGGRVSVLESMGVNAAITEGKFKMGYLADDEHRRQFPVKDFIDPEKG